MAYAFVVYTGNGSTTQFSIPFSYIRREHIKVYVNYVDTAYTYVNDTTVLLASAPANGVRVEVRRVTPAATRLVDFADGAVLTAADLDTANLQQLYLQQELDDDLGKTVQVDDATGLLTAGGQRITSVGTPVAATDAATKNYVDTFVNQTANIADSAITSAKIADGTIATADLANSAVTTAKIADTNVTTGKIADDAVTTAKLAASSVTTAKIADSNVTTAKIADSAVTSAKIADGGIATVDLADQSVTTAKIADANVTALKIADGNVTTGKLADGAVTSAKIADGTIVAGDLASDSVTTAKIVDANVTTAKLADSGVTTAKINDAAVTGAKIASGTIDSSKLTGATVVTNAEVPGVTVNDTSFFTTSASDLRYFRQDSSETIASGDAWSGSDNFIATTAAIDARIIDLVDDVGGFVPIANETSFPVTNPDINNPDGAGTIISIKEIVTTRTPSSGTVTIANGSGSNTVTINGCGSTVLASGFGVLVETTSTLHTYTFHRLVPKATEVTTVAGISTQITTVSNNVSDITTVANDLNEPTSEIETVAGSIANVDAVGGSIANVNTVASNLTAVNSFANLYRIASSDPTTSLDTGDLVFNTTSNRLRIYNGTAWQDGVTATGDLVSKTGDTMTGALGITSGSAGSPSLFISGDTNTGIYSPGADQVAISTGGSGRLFVDANGNVGMGISSPSTRLDVRGPSEASIRWGTTSNFYGTLYADSTLTTLNSYNSNPLAFSVSTGTSYSEKMRLDTSGRLGLGTTGTVNSSVALLAIRQTGGDLSSTTVTRANAQGIVVADASSPTNNLGNGIWFDSGALLAGIASTRINTGNWGTDLRFYTHPTTTSNVDETYERVRIDSSGRVGIGTTPSYKLDINTGSNDRVRIVDGASATLELERTGAKSFLIQSTNDSGLRIYDEDAGSERCRVDTSGRLLIGTSTGRTANSQNASFQLEGTSASTGSASIIRNGGNPYFGLYRTGSASIGSVTAVPGDAGLAEIDFGGADGTNVATGAYILAVNDSGSAWTTSSHPTRLAFSTTASGASSPTERLRIAQNGAWGLAGANYGTSGQVLTSQGSGAAPQWASPSGGKILQVVSANYRDITSFSISNNTRYVWTGMGVTITPSSTSSKIIVSLQLMGGWSAANAQHESTVTLSRRVGGADYVFGDNDSPPGTPGNRNVGISTSQVCISNDNNQGPHSYIINGWYDQPATTSAITYYPALKFNVGSTQTYYVNRSYNDSNDADHERCYSWITAMEVAG